MPKKDKQTEREKIDYPKLLKLNKLMMVVTAKDGSIPTKEEDILDWEIVYSKNLAF